MSRDSSCTARNISYVFRVLLGWALYPSSSLFHPPSLSLLPAPYSPLLFCPLMSDVISSQPGMAASSGSNLVLTPTQFLHPRTLALTPCQKSAELQIKIWPICLSSWFYLSFSSSFFSRFLYQTAKFRLTPELSNFNFWCISTSHSLRHCLSTAGRWKW